MGMASSRFSRAPLRSMKTGSITRLKTADQSGEKVFMCLSLRKVNSIKTVIATVNTTPKKLMRRKMVSIISLLAQWSPALGAKLLP
jgi:hypothetical protein